MCLNGVPSDFRFMSMKRRVQVRRHPCCKVGAQLINEFIYFNKILFWIFQADSLHVSSKYCAVLVHRLLRQVKIILIPICLYSYNCMQTDKINNCIFSKQLYYKIFEHTKLMFNSIGPDILPCGTPLFTSSSRSFHLNCCFLFCKRER